MTVNILSLPCEAVELPSATETWRSATGSFRGRTSKALQTAEMGSFTTHWGNHPDELNQACANSCAKGKASKTFVVV